MHRVGLSRRGFFAGVWAGLTACLVGKAAAQERRVKSTAKLPSGALPVGRVQVFRYDSQSRLIRMAEGQETVASYTYTSGSYPSTFGFGAVTTYCYDRD